MPIMLIWEWLLWDTVELSIWANVQRTALRVSIGWGMCSSPVILGLQLPSALTSIAKSEECWEVQSISIRRAALWPPLELKVVGIISVGRDKSYRGYPPMGLFGFCPNAKLSHLEEVCETVWVPAGSHLLILFSYTRKEKNMLSAFGEGP